MEFILNNRCPACNSEAISQVNDFSVSNRNKGVFPDYYRVFVCHNCHLWFKDRFPREDAIVQHYNDLQLTDDPWDYHHRLPHEIKLDHEFRNLSDKAKVLDVGCWTGRLLAEHPELDRYGIEPNPQSSSVAAGKGIHILGRTVTEEVLGNIKFDLITMIDVFEHLNTPVEVVKLLVRHLNSGGKLVIVTGNTDSFPVRLVRSTYWYMSVVPDHIVFLNRKFISWLQGQLDVSSVYVTPIRHYHFQFRKYLKELAWLLIWRYADPNSPFKRLAIFKLPIFRRFANFKDIIICTNWRDHYYVVFEKK